jgi:GT2 family glycosyltransferase
MTNLKSSIIICTRNRSDDLEHCIQSIIHQKVRPHELIIIDSSDLPLNEQKSFQQLLFNERILPDIQLVYKHTKPGLTYQRNIGIACATGDIIYFFDDDVVLDCEYVSIMQRTFAEHAQFGGGMGAITNMPAQAPWHYRILRTIFLLQRDHATGYFTQSGMPTHAYGTKKFKPVQVLGGCGMAFRRDLFKHDQFDEQLRGYAYLEDADFSYRVAQHVPLFFNPAAQLRHNNSPLSRDALIKNKAMFIRNYSYLFFKNIYPHHRLKIIAYCWSILGLFVEAICYRQWSAARGYVQGLKEYYAR